ncbi:hypothetical protein LG325_03270 [Marinobacter nauticus]
MTTARLRSTRRAWPCSGQDLAHRPQNRSALASMSGVDDRPLIPNRSCEHQRNEGQVPSQSEARRPGPPATAVAGAAHTGGATVHLTRREAQQLTKSLERQLKAIRSSLAFWKHEISCFQTQPPFSLEAKEFEAELIQRLFLELYDITKTNAKHETAYKTAKYQEQ